MNSMLARDNKSQRNRATLDYVEINQQFAFSVNQKL